MIIWIKVINNPIGSQYYDNIKFYHKEIFSEYNVKKEGVYAICGSYFMFYTSILATNDTIESVRLFAFGKGTNISRVYGIN